MSNRTVKEDCIFFHGEQWMEGYMRFCTNDLVCSQVEIDAALKFDCTHCPYYCSLGRAKNIIKELLREEMLRKENAGS